MGLLDGQQLDQQAPQLKQGADEAIRQLWLKQQAEQSQAAQSQQAARQMLQSPGQNQQQQQAQQYLATLPQNGAGAGQNAPTASQLPINGPQVPPSPQQAAQQSPTPVKDASSALFQSLTQPLMPPKMGFRQGMGAAMLAYAGVKTPFEQQVEAQRGNTGAYNAIETGQYHQQVANQYAMQPTPQAWVDQFGMPPQMPSNAIAAFAKMMGTEQGKNNRNAANIQSRRDLLFAKQQVESGKVTKWIPEDDGQGGMIYNGYNNRGERVPEASISDALIPGLMKNASSTIEYKELQDGSIVALPKTTTSGKQIPSAGAPTQAASQNGAASGSVPASPNTSPRLPAGAITPRPVVDKQGNPLIGATTPALDKSFNFSATMLERFAKPLEDSMPRFGRLIDTLNQKTPQADALVAPELLTVMAGGQGSGLRMNEAEIARIVGGRTNFESLKAALNKWQLDPSKGLSITDAQRGQIRSLITEVNKRMGAKQNILDQARSDLILAKSPTEHRQIVAKAQKQMSDIDLHGVQDDILPDAAAAKLTEGQPTTFNNGQTWTKRGGKPVRLK